MDDCTQRWKLPELLIVKTKLPPALTNGTINGNHNHYHTKSDGGSGTGSHLQQNLANNMNRVPSKTAPPSLSFDNEDDEDENHHSVLLKKFEKCDKDDFTENYFKPKRASELIIKAQQDANRVSNIAHKLTINGSNGNNILSSWNNNYNNGKNATSNGGANHHSWGPSPVQNGWGSAGLTGFLSSPEMNSLRRPTKLEALPLEATQKGFRKLKTGAGGQAEFAQG